MFYYTLFGKGLEDLGNRFPSIEAAIFWVLDDSLLYGELMSLLDYQYVKIDFVDKSLVELGNDSPLDLYCSYTSDQILVALGKHTEKKKSSFREGVLYLAEKSLDVFFVTLNKWVTPINDAKRNLIQRRIDMLVSFIKWSGLRLLLFSILTLMSLMIGLFTVSGVLFESRDLDQLFSYPLSSNQIFSQK